MVMNKPNPLAYTMYAELYRQTELNTDCSNWAGMVNKLLCDLGFRNVWLQQGVVNRNKFLCEIKQRLTDHFITKWHSQMNNSSDALLYREVKVVLEHSNYFNIIAVPKYRYAFVKFLTKNSKIPVVVGKWHRPRPYHQRLCEECDSLGDEYHFLLVCKRFDDLRGRYIPRYYRRNPSMEKCKMLLMSEHQKTIRNLAIFIYKSMQMIETV